MQMTKTLCRILLASAMLAAPAACVEEVTLPEAPPSSELGVGESRTVELRFLRFDVTEFKQTLTLEDLKDMPPAVLEQTWLLDLDMTAFTRGALEQITFAPPDEVYAWPQASRNLWELLNMTPESADLSGTSLSGLLGVGQAVGLPASQILADMVQVGGNERIVPTSLTAEAVLDDVIGTHPNAQWRRGPIDAAHPDGLYPVAPHSIPVSLADVVNNFQGLPERYGPAEPDPDDPDAPVHPGFIVSSAPVVAALDDFSMTVKVDINALPYKGVDATNATVASVNSTASQIESLFDFSTPDWLELQGLAEDLSISELTMVIHESPDFLPGGASREPLPTGDSPAWAAPPWEFEHLLVDAGFRKAEEIGPHCTPYSPSGSGDSSFTAVEVCIDDTGWTEISVDESVVLEDPPPQPSYFWDILVEVAQVRLHDGGLAEGEGDIELTVRDVPIGLTTEELTAKIRQNIEEDPAGLTGVAQQLNDNTAGDADFYYYQPDPLGTGGDYLYFVTPADLRLDAEGEPARPYTYQHPGFYSDPELTQKVSSTEEIDGDTEHEKVKIEPGTTLYIEDDAGRRFAVSVGPKPSGHRISLTLKRIQ
ncbi:MAG: acetyltransferase [Polyangiaceae bacterium]|nr:acetyltransferase [Polyangiaceae bacterium]